MRALSVAAVSDAMNPFRSTVFGAAPAPLVLLVVVLVTCFLAMGLPRPIVTRFGRRSGRRTAPPEISAPDRADGPQSGQPTSRTTGFDPATGMAKVYNGDLQAKAACAAVAYAIARGNLRAVQDFSRMDISGIIVA